MKKRISVIGMAVWGSVMALPWPALAEEGKKGSLPQLDATTFPGLLFWLAVSFPTLFLLMRFLAVPRVQKALTNRRDVLRVDLDAAQKANEEAQALRADYERALSDARAQAQATVLSITQHAAAEEAERRAVQQKELAQRVAEAEARISGFREKALEEAREAAADLADAIVDRLIGAKAT